jgi:hypothetical protein
MDSDPTDPSGRSTDAPGGEVGEAPPSPDPPPAGGPEDGTISESEAAPTEGVDGQPSDAAAAEGEGVPPGQFAHVAVDEETFYRLEAAVATDLHGVDGLSDSTGLDEPEPRGKAGAEGEPGGEDSFSPSFSGGLVDRDDETEATPLVQRLLPGRLGEAIADEETRGNLILSVGVLAFLASVGLVTYWYTRSIGFSLTEGVALVGGGLAITGLFLAHAFGAFGQEPSDKSLRLQ